MPDHDNDAEPVSPEALPVAFDDVPQGAEPGERANGFTRERKRRFLKELKETGCVFDACRRTGVARATVYRHQRLDNHFFNDCETALHMAGHDVELSLWQRAVLGVHEDVIAYGKFVGTRIRRSDPLLKLLAQGTYPEKYGQRIGFRRKEALPPPEATDEAADKSEILADIRARLDDMRQRREALLADQGWTRVGEDWIPPGWVRAQPGTG